ncbi:hypothetical protein BH10ACT11_BH10ACT11_04830 [soil metagenome]
MSVREQLEVATPFDAEGMLGFLGTRAIAGIEEVSDGTYRRSLRLQGGPALVEVGIAANAVEVELWPTRSVDRAEASAAVRRLFDLDTDPGPIDRALSTDPLMAPLVARRPGRRLPGAVEPGEMAMRAVLGQQVSVAAGITLAGRLVTELGEPLAEPRGAVTHLLPTMDRLAGVDPASLAMPASRKRALVAICSALADGSLDLSPGADPEGARAAMVALPGIGPWTAEYVAMRGLGDGDAFLASDLGVRRALERLGVDGSPSNALEIAKRWRPFRAYAQQHLWASLGDSAAA